MITASASTNRVPAFMRESKAAAVTQYVDAAGNPLMDLSVNPNGGLFALEGLMSEDGRVLGKMGHSIDFHAGEVNPDENMKSSRFLVRSAALGTSGWLAE